MLSFVRRDRAAGTTSGGGGFIPDSDRSEFDIDVQTPPGSNLDYMRLKLEEIGRIVRAHPEVAYTYATVGDAAGSGRVDDADIYVRLVPKAHAHVSAARSSPQTVRDEIARVRRRHGVRVLERIRRPAQADPGGYPRHDAGGARRDSPSECWRRSRTRAGRGR